jgi:hypothetical protein
MSDWDGETTAHAAEGPQWVSAAEAADAAGVTPGTVRYWARNGLIVSEVVGGPGGERTLVRLDEVVRHARGGGGNAAGQGGSAAGGPGGVVTDLPARTSELAPILKSIPEIMAQLTAATDRAARAETKVEFLSAQLAEARRRLAEAEAGRTAPPDPVMPPGWDEPHPPAGSAELETATRSGDDARGGAGWPAPPEASTQMPAGGSSAAGAPEPGPESIDWGAGSAEEAPSEDGRGTGTGEAPTRGTDGTAGGPSLGEIWAQPARRDVPGAQADAPDAIEWHEPAQAETEHDAATAATPLPSPRRANADIPDETFYGPRRRRWFRRRR